MAPPCPNCEIFAGVARLPREMAAGEPSAYLAIEFEIDMECNTINDVACTAIPVLCEHVLKSVLMGKEPAASIAEAQLTLETRYHGIGKAAILAALGNALQEYKHKKAINGQRGRDTPVR